MGPGTPRVVLAGGGGAGGAVGPVGPHIRARCWALVIASAGPSQRASGRTGVQCSSCFITNGVRFTF